jgi:hypothetical protein
MPFQKKPIRPSVHLLIIEIMTNGVHGLEELRKKTNF